MTTTPSSDATITLDVSDGLARLTLNQPDIGNPFNLESSREFGEVANEIAGRRDVRAILLAARGRYFSVGGDLSMFAADLEAVPDIVRTATAGLHMGLARLLRLDAPIIASVHGSAAGGAVSLLANCDLVIAGQAATFTAAYARIGFTCDLGATTGLAARMGPARARRFLLLSETLDAAQAERAGLVDEVIADAELEQHALSMAEKLAAGPTRAYGEVRRLLARALAQPIEAQLEDEAQALARAGSTADAREGITAFVERRRPIFTGK